MRAKIIVHFKIKYFSFALIYFFTQNTFGQKTLFTKGVHIDEYRKTGYFSYHVKGNSYKLKGNNNPFGFFSWNPGGFSRFFRNYFIGYDSLRPEKAKVYFNKPYFDPQMPQYSKVMTTGKIISINKRYCVYQFMANKANQEPVTSRQAITTEDIEKNNITKGSSLKVQYLLEEPEVSIIYYDRSAKDTSINFKKPFLSKPNGYVFDIEANSLIMNPNSINQYLSKYSQPQINSIIPVFIFNVNACHKSGFWGGFGLGGGPKLFTGKLGIGYLQKLNRKLYINASTHLSGFDYTIPSFANEQLNTVVGNSVFECTNWSLNPKIDLAWRISKNNVWGCQFFKIGIGAFLNLYPNNDWTYAIGQNVPSYHGGQHIDYKFSSYLNNLPHFPSNIFYISISYSFCNFKKQ